MIKPHCYNSIMKLLKNPMYIDDGIPRDLLSELTHIPRTTLFDNLRILEKEGRVERISKLTGEKGRPLIYWHYIKNS